MPPRLLAKPRMVIEITKEQKNKLNKYLAHGEQRRVFSAILEDVISMLDEFGHAFVSFMLEREFSYRIQMREYHANRQLADSSPIESDTRATIATDSPSSHEASSTA